jgi:hypothetical protein
MKKRSVRAFGFVVPAGSTVTTSTVRQDGVLVV